MAARTRPPFRADHVGSLLRPPRLMRARADHAEGAISADELRAVEDEAIREAVALQRDAGLRSATDGEFRRASWHMDFIYQLGGVSQVEGERIHVKFRDESGEYDYSPPAMCVDGRVRIEHTIFGDAFTFLQRLLGIDFLAAAKMLAERCGVETNDNNSKLVQKPQPAPHAILPSRELLNERGSGVAVTSGE